MGEDVVVSFKGRVVEVRKQLIPRMYVTVLESAEGFRVEFDTHQDLVVYREGEELEFTVSRGVPSYREGEDYVVHATVASIREEGGVKRYLLSAGGLLFIIESPRDLGLKPTEKVYAKVARLR